jgi:hypothetical protein
MATQAREAVWEDVDLPEGFREQGRTPSSTLSTSHVLVDAKCTLLRLIVVFAILGPCPTEATCCAR